MTTHTQTEAKSTSTLIPAMQPAHSSLLPQLELEEPARSLLPTEDWLRSPSSPTPPPINPSVGHSFGTMAIGTTTTPVLQRMAIAGNGIVQRQVNPEEESKEEEPIQAKAITGSSLHAITVQNGQEERKRTNQTGLPDALKAGVENLSGYSLDDVRVHYNSPKPAQLQALAYTQGTEIHVAPGQEEYLPHEAWHVVQQMQRRVKPTMQMKGVQINDEVAMEKEADEMVEKVTNIINPKIDHYPTFIGNSFILHQKSTIPSKDVVQKATRLSIEPMNGYSIIRGTHHQRSAVHKVAMQWVLNNGAWKSVPSNEVCNHSRDYESISQEILYEIHGLPIKRAAKYVKAVYEDLEGKHKGIQAASANHNTRMQSIINTPTDGLLQQEVEDTFNYYLYKICDYPANLFYWPEKTDGDPDEPTGFYDDKNSALYWEVSNPLISKQNRLKREQKRLMEARNEVHDALQ